MGECAGADEAQRQPRYRDYTGERRPSNQLKPQLAANQGGRTLQAFDGHVAFRLQNAVDLCTASVHALGELRLGDALAFHLPDKLPGDDAGHRFGICRFTDAFLRQEGIESSAPMGILRAHACISFIRRRARSKSPAGVL